MTRVVLDSNIYISALGVGGVAARVISAGLAGEYEIATSDLIRAEVETTLRRKFKWSDERLSQLEFAVWSSALFVSSLGAVQVCRDSKDDHLLETCVASGAEFLVSGDQDLLVLSAFEGIRIVTLRFFVDELAARRR